MLYGLIRFSVQQMNNFQNVVWKNIFAHTIYVQLVHMLYGKKYSFHRKYIQIVHMLYGRLNYHFSLFKLTE